MKKTFRSEPWTLVFSVAALIGLALGAALVNAQEPVKTPAPSQPVEAVLEIEPAEEALDGPHAGLTCRASGAVPSQQEWR